MECEQANYRRKIKGFKSVKREEKVEYGIVKRIEEKKKKNAKKRKRKQE